MPKPIKKQVWNNVDAFGLINGIGTWDENYLNLRYVRIPDESNVDLRHKINNFRDNPITGTSQQDLINGLANELNLEPYDTFSKSTFTLTKTPYPIEPSGIQDIFVYYQEPNTSGWTPIGPQYWNEDVKNATPTSGFICWEDGYYAKSYTDRKPNNYSRLLKVYNDLPDLSRIKIVYTVERFDSDNNRVYMGYTDMSYPDYDQIDPQGEFVYRKATVVNSGMLLTSPIVYTLDKIPSELKPNYYDNSGKGTETLYRVRDNIDKLYRNRWENISDRSTIWDVNMGFGSGTIPSFYDVELKTDNITSYTSFVGGALTGGVDYFNPALYLMDIDIVHNDATDTDHWYPVLKPGKFYYNGKTHYLMQNPSGIIMDLSSGQTALPTGVEIFHKAIINTAHTSVDTGHIFEDVDYKVNYINSDNVFSGVYNPNPDIARKKAYLTSDMGFVQTLNSGEYMIDYMSGVIYSNGIYNCVFYYDDVEVPDRVTIQHKRTDLNPINDTRLGYSEYFITIGV